MAERKRDNFGTPTTGEAGPLSDIEKARRLEYEEAARRARFNRWDQIEKQAERSGWRIPEGNHKVLWQDATGLAPTPLERTPSTDPAAPAKTFEEIGPLEETMIVLPEFVAAAPAAKRRSQLVMRLEAAKKLAYAAGKDGQGRRRKPAMAAE